MKELKFKTSNGEFLVVDGNDYRYPHYMFTKFGLRYVVVSEITEEQASNIVESNIAGRFLSYDSLYENYRNSIESLHSLLKSKGITELNNKYIFKLQ